MTQTPRFLEMHEPIPGLDGRTVGDFWQWAYSDLLANTTRSVFAEYIVGIALSATDKARLEWESTDLSYGEVKIEVKASAHCQSWHQEKPSAIQFSIRKATVWNRHTGKYEGQPTRCADVYVFCLYPEKDTSKANVLDVPAWDFYVVSTVVLNREFGEAKSLSLSTVKRIGVHCKFDSLRAAVDRMSAANSATTSVDQHR
jgi:hypothetical protein